MEGPYLPKDERAFSITLFYFSFFSFSFSSFSISLLGNISSIFLFYLDWSTYLFSYISYYSMFYFYISHFISFMFAFYIFCFSFFINLCLCTFLSLDRCLFCSYYFALFSLSLSCGVITLPEACLYLQSQNEKNECCKVQRTISPLHFTNIWKI